ncbi:hypothetical protein EOM86_05185 [Candidatus Nomurabacteria bacterium]|nr:hypothetical protein [Candidatus Nomurabacteria bacterium]
MNLKIPEGCIKRANDLGIKAQVIAFFRMKTLNEHGFIRLGEIPVAALYLGISDRTLRRWLDQCQRVGLIYRDGGGYGLISYDGLFRKLGYDMSPKTTRSGRSRAGRFKIFKINAQHRDKLLAIIAREEAALNMSRQEYAINRKLTQKHKSGNVNVNRSVSLSCSGLARLLGYSSPSTGHRLEASMDGVGCEIERRLRVAKAAEIGFLYHGVMLCNAPNNILIY